MEDFAQNFPNVTLLRFINSNDITDRTLKNAKEFEKISGGKFKVLVPDNQVHREDAIPVSFLLYLF